MSAPVGAGARLPSVTRWPLFVLTVTVAGALLLLRERVA